MEENTPQEESRWDWQPWQVSLIAIGTLLTGILIGWGLYRMTLLDKSASLPTATCDEACKCEQFRWVELGQVPASCFRYYH